MAPSLLEAPTYQTDDQPGQTASQERLDWTGLFLFMFKPVRDLHQLIMPILSLHRWKIQSSLFIISRIYSPFLGLERRVDWRGIYFLSLSTWPFYIYSFVKCLDSQKIQKKQQNVEETIILEGTIIYNISLRSVMFSFVLSEIQTWRRFSRLLYCLDFWLV